MTIVDMTLDEIRGLRMALRWGVPYPIPEVVASATQKLGAAQREAEANASDQERSS